MIRNVRLIGRACRSEVIDVLHEIAECWEGKLRPILREEEIAIIEPADYAPQIREAGVLKADGSYEPATASAAAVDAQQKLASRG